MKYFLLLILFFVNTFVFSQNDKKLNQLFYSGNYSTYVSFFEENYPTDDFETLSSEIVSQYIISLLKSNFNSNDIIPTRRLKLLRDKIENFILSNNSKTKENLYYEFGKSEFNIDRFKSSIKFLEKIEPKTDEINYLIGVAYFNDRNYEASKDFISKVEGQEFTDNANYFLGVISYLEDNFERAKNYFDRISDISLENKFLQYIISINYLEGNYNEAILNLKKVNELTLNSDYCYFFIGKSYFVINDFENSINTLSYIKNTIDRDEEISFMEGYSHYMLKDYESAKKIFKSLSYSSSKYSQYSSFYLGLIFLDEEDFNLAKNYFYASYKKDDDENYTIKSLLNYAKTNYEVGDYDLSIAVINKLKSTYPLYVNETMDELLSENYFMTNDYSRIIQYLNSKKNISSDEKIKFQYVTYQKGVNEFNRGNFANSIKYFDLSQKYNSDKEIYLKSILNESEAHFIGNNYKKATDEILKVYSQTMANELKSKFALVLGYSFFNLNDYSLASTYLKSFLDINGKLNEKSDLDALLRLADSYYASKRFDLAITYYGESLELNEINRNYINYQLGLCYYGLNDFTNSIVYMDKVMNSSEISLHDDAIFRKAQIYFENSEFDMSITNFSELISRFKFSEYLPFSYLNRATSYFNLRSYDQAEADYLHILNNINDSKIQSEALLGMQKIVSYTNNFSQLNQLITNYKNKFPENNDISKIQFDNIRNLYFNQKYEDLIDYTNKIKAEDEISYNKYETNYYLAESLFNIKEFNQASTIYEILLDSINSKYFSRSLNRLAQINLNIKDYDKSLMYYKKLESSSNNNREKIDSYIGSLTNYYYLKKYDSVQYYSNQINNFDKISFTNRNKINLLSAKSFIDTGNTSNAIDKLLTTMNLVKDESAAEANFLLAQLFYKNSQKNQALESLYSLNENFSNYEYWVGKSYILIADIFMSMGENFQANATLESLIENSQIDDIVQEATVLKNKISLDE